MASFLKPHNASAQDMRIPLVSALDLLRHEKAYDAKARERSHFGTTEALTSIAAAFVEETKREKAEQLVGCSGNSSAKYSSATATTATTMKLDNKGEKRKVMVIGEEEVPPDGQQSKAHSHNYDKNKEDDEDDEKLLLGIAAKTSKADFSLPQEVPSSSSSEDNKETDSSWANEALRNTHKYTHLTAAIKKETIAYANRPKTTATRTERAEKAEEKSDGRIAGGPSSPPSLLDLLLTYAAASGENADTAAYVASHFMKTADGVGLWTSRLKKKITEVLLFTEKVAPSKYHHDDLGPLLIFLSSLLKVWSPFSVITPETHAFSEFLISQCVPWLLNLVGGGGTKDIETVQKKKDNQNRGGYVDSSCEEVSKEGDVAGKGGVYGEYNDNDKDETNSISINSYLCLYCAVTLVESFANDMVAHAESGLLQQYLGIDGDEIVWRHLRGQCVSAITKAFSVFVPADNQYAPDDSDDQNKSMGPIDRRLIQKSHQMSSRVSSRRLFRVAVVDILSNSVLSSLYEERVAIRAQTHLSCDKDRARAIERLKAEKEEAEEEEHRRKQTQKERSDQVRRRPLPPFVPNFVTLETVAGLVRDVCTVISTSSRSVREVLELVLALQTGPYDSIAVVRQGMRGHLLRAIAKATLELNEGWRAAHPSSSTTTTSSASPYLFSLSCRTSLVCLGVEAALFIGMGIEEDQDQEEEKEQQFIGTVTDETEEVIENVWLEIVSGGDSSREKDSYATDPPSSFIQCVFDFVLASVVTVGIGGTTRLLEKRLQTTSRASLSSSSSFSFPKKLVLATLSIGLTLYAEVSLALDRRRRRRGKKSTKSKMRTALLNEGERAEEEREEEEKEEEEGHFNSHEIDFDSCIDGQIAARISTAWFSLCARYERFTLSPHLTKDVSNVEPKLLEILLEGESVSERVEKKSGNAGTGKGKQIAENALCTKMLQQRTSFLHTILIPCSRRFPHLFVSRWAAMLVDTQIPELETASAFVLSSLLFIEPFFAGDRNNNNNNNNNNNELGDARTRTKESFAALRKKRALSDVRALRYQVSRALVGAMNTSPRLWNSPSAFFGPSLPSALTPSSAHSFLVACLYGDDIVGSIRDASYSFSGCFMWPRSTDHTPLGVLLACLLGSIDQSENGGNSNLTAAKAEEEEENEFIEELFNEQSTGGSLTLRLCPLRDGATSSRSVHRHDASYKRPQSAATSLYCTQTSYRWLRWFSHPKVGGLHFIDQVICGATRRSTVGKNEEENTTKRLRDLPDYNAHQSTSKTDHSEDPSEGKPTVTGHADERNEGEKAFKSKVGTSAFTSPADIGAFWSAEQQNEEIHGLGEGAVSTQEETPSEQTAIGGDRAQLASTSFLEKLLLSYFLTAIHKDNSEGKAHAHDMKCEVPLSLEKDAFKHVARLLLTHFTSSILPNCGKNKPTAATSCTVAIYDDVGSVIERLATVRDAWRAAADELSARQNATIKSGVDGDSARNTDNVRALADLLRSQLVCAFAESLSAEITTILTGTRGLGVYMYELLEKTLRTFLNEALWRPKRTRQISSPPNPMAPTLTNPILASPFLVTALFLPILRSGVGTRDEASSMANKTTNSSAHNDNRGNVLTEDVPRSLRRLCAEILANSSTTNPQWWLGTVSAEAAKAIKKCCSQSLEENNSQEDNSQSNLLRVTESYTKSANDVLKWLHCLCSALAEIVFVGGLRETAEPFTSTYASSNNSTQSSTNDNEKQEGVTASPTFVYRGWLASIGSSLPLHVAAEAYEHLASHSLEITKGMAMSMVMKKNEERTEGAQNANQKSDVALQPSGPPPTAVMAACRDFICLFIAASQIPFLIDQKGGGNKRNEEKDERLESLAHLSPTFYQNYLFFLSRIEGLVEIVVAAKISAKSIDMDNNSNNVMSKGETDELSIPFSGGDFLQAMQQQQQQPNTPRKDTTGQHAYMYSIRTSARNLYAKLLVNWKDACLDYLIGAVSGVYGVEGGVLVGGVERENADLMTKTLFSFLAQVVKIKMADENTKPPFGGEGSDRDRYPHVQQPSGGLALTQYQQKALQTLAMASDSTAANSLVAANSVHSRGSLPNETRALLKSILPMIIS